jgi:hypothetical protein
MGVNCRFKVGFDALDKVNRRTNQLELEQIRQRKGWTRKDLGIS